MSNKTGVYSQVYSRSIGNISEASGFNIFFAITIVTTTFSCDMFPKRFFNANLLMYSSELEVMIVKPC